MKKFLIGLLIIPVFAFSQTKKISYYANPNLLLRKSFSSVSPVPGVGINGGLLIRNFGIGAGIEYFKIYSDLKAAVPVYFDVRYFFKRNNTIAKNVNPVPFIGADIGKLIWSESSVNGTYTDNFTNNYEGKYFFAFDAGVVISKNSKTGFSLAIGYINFVDDRSGIHKTYRTAAGLLVQEPIITKYPAIRENRSEIQLKLGYMF